MKNKRWISVFTVFAMMFSLLNPVMLFAGGDMGESTIDRNEKKYEELIVAIEYREVAAEDRLNTLENVVDLHKELLNKQGLTIKEGALGAKDREQIPTRADNRSNSSKIAEAWLKHSGHVYLVDNSDGEKSLEAIRKDLETDLAKFGLSLRYVEPNYTTSIEQSSPDEPLKVESTLNSNQRPHYEMVHLEQAWELTTGAEEILIAVLDSGIDHNHESLSEVVDQSLGKNFSADGAPEDTMDYQGHGTHVAGTIASYNEVDGMMKSATLIPVKVVGDNGSGSTNDARMGVKHAVEMGAKVINMSLGGADHSQAFEDACDFAVENGVTVIAASGNNSKSELSYPAGFESVISVGAVTLQGERASFSNYGAGLDVMAPGVRIYSTVPGNGYDDKHGTSMASPHVAGLAGLMYSLNPDLSAAEIRGILHETSAYPNGENQLEYGYGLINAYEAAQFLVEAEEEDDSDTTLPEVHLETLETSQRVVYPGEMLEVRVKATDEVSGIEYVSFSYKNEQSDETLSRDVFSPDEEGYFKGTVKIAEDTHDGKWSMTGITAKDHNGNIRNYLRSSYDISPGDFDVYPDGVPVNRLEDTYILSSTTWNYRTIEGDLYIGPEAVLTIDGDVKVGGNIYVLGAVVSYGDLTAKELRGSSIIYGWSSSPYSKGTVNIRSGSHDFTGMYASSQPIPGIPLNLLHDPVVNDDGVIQKIEGETLPIAELYLDGVKQEYNFNGTFEITEHYVGYNDEIFLVMEDVFGAAHEYRIAIAEPKTPELTGILIESLPGREHYYVGQSFEAEGLRVNKLYSDGSDVAIPLEDLILKGFNSEEAIEDQMITIEYEGFSETFTVTIHESGTPVAETVEAGPVNKGDVLSAALLDGMFKDPYTGENVPGELRWKDENLVVLQTEEQPWVFTPEYEWYETVEGNVTVEVLPPFKRISGSNRYLTAYEIAKEYNSNTETVILVRGDSIDSVPQVVDGLTASGLAGALDARILITESESLSPDTRDALMSLNPRNVIIVGGTAAVSDEVAAELEAMDSVDLNIRRISGANRYATAAEVALEIGTARDNTALIVNGRSDVDSLVAGPLAHKGYPILMVDNGRDLIPEETRDAMKALNIEKVIIVGGTGVVSLELEEQLNALEEITVKERFGGSTRVETSILLAQHEAFEGDNQVSIVNGWSYVDAVAASTLGNPVIYFSKQQGITENIEGFLSTKLGFTAIGGTAVIPEEIYQSIKELF